MKLINLQIMAVMLAIGAAVFVSNNQQTYSATGPNAGYGWILDLVKGGGIASAVVAVLTTVLRVYNPTLAAIVDAILGGKFSPNPPSPNTTNSDKDELPGPVIGPGDPARRAEEKARRELDAVFVLSTAPDQTHVIGDVTISVSREEPPKPRGAKS